MCLGMCLFCVLVDLSLSLFWSMKLFSVFTIKCIIAGEKHRILLKYALVGCNCELCLGKVADNQSISHSNSPRNSTKFPIKRKIFPKTNYILQHVVSNELTHKKILTRKSIPEIQIDLKEKKTTILFYENENNRKRGRQRETEREKKQKIEWISIC